ncbi:MAG: holo-ACP synthase [Syntrophotaleaceae bacterium]
MPRISGLGVDTVRCSRFRRFLEQGKRAVIDRLFDEDEQAYALAKKDPAPYLAVRFAAKEAFLKALGTGLRYGIAWREIGVRRDELGRPYLVLSGQAAVEFQTRGHHHMHLSCSHDGDYAFATVILESSRGE